MAALWRVTAGDKNAGITAEERAARLQAGDPTAFGVDPIHRFFVIDAHDDDGMGAIRAAWGRLGAKSSDDLPRPFTMERVDESEYVVAEKPRRRRR
jgi:hypothetical protein